MNPNSRIVVAAHRGMLGSSRLARPFKAEPLVASNRARRSVKRAKVTAQPKTQSMPVATETT